MECCTENDRFGWHTTPYQIRKEMLLVTDCLRKEDAFDFEDESVLMRWEGLLREDNLTNLNEVPEDLNQVPEDNLYGSSLAPTV